MARNIAFVVANVLSFIAVVKGHGRLIDPASRSSIWRFKDYLDLSDEDKAKVEPNYQDNELFCGGFQYQQDLGGQCGICGDPYDANVKDNEAGGKYAKGIIVKKYETPGAWVNAQVEITAHHKGYFEFRLCPWNNPTVSVSECENWYVLDTDSSAGTQWHLPESTGGAQVFNVAIKLPEGVSCEQCVLQWRYHTGNSWGCFGDETCCVGCGPQEEFYGCADVSIGNGETVNPSSTTKAKPTTSPLMSAIQSSAATTTSTTTSTAAPPTTTTSENTPTTTSTTTTTTTTTTTPGEPSDDICELYENSIKMKDCTSFYMCSNGTPFAFDCPAGTVWNDVRKGCDHPYNVEPNCGTKLW